jgi:dihydropteroate synthase
MKIMGVDPAGIQRMTHKARSANVMVEALPCAMANILKQEMLALGADAAVARGAVACSLPHTDVLLMGSLKQLEQLSERLASQPFGLADLGRELQQVLGKFHAAPTTLHGKGCQLSLSRPCVMGIINATPDSFYDGGACVALDDALRQAEKQLKDGADLLDVGGESTRPGSAAVSLSVEMERTVPLIEALQREFDIPLSIDTNKAVVAEAAVAAGAAFVNDISGLTFDPNMAAVVAQSGAGLFVMHTRGRPEVMQQDTEYADVLAEVIAGLRHSLLLAKDAGVADCSLAVDPGIGFGKSAEGNLEILRRLSELKSLGYPVLLGTSRKSFIGKVLDQPEPDQRLFGSLATAVHGVSQGAQLFRVHDVAATRQAVDMAWAIVHG